MLDDTICAISTANGIGAISIVRVSGSDSLSVALKISSKDNFIPRVATLCDIYDSSKNIIDEVLVIYFKAPYSFTGEDIVEFHCHGGVAVCNIILDELVSNSIRLAYGGEFSKRAFLNNKIDLSKANAISSLIEARSKDAVKLLARQLKGELSNFVNDIREELLYILAYSEVGIDYADEDLPSNIQLNIQNRLKNIIKKLKNTLKSSQRRDTFLNGFKVCIIGKPNVGKSSLLNRFLDYDRAIVSSIKGTTRDSIEESIKIGTHIIKIVDTAGIRHSVNKIEKIGIEKSFELVNESDIIIALFDASKIVSKDDKKILDLIENLSKDILIVVNKSDLKMRFDTSLLKDFIAISTKNDINALLYKLEILLDSKTSNHDTILIAKQQVLCVENTLDNIISSQNLIIDGQLELFSYHINEAIKNISDITRPYDNNEMLDIMFGEFCLGK